MKKQFAIMLILVVGLSLSACGNKDDQDTSLKKTNNPITKKVEKKTLKDWFGGEKTVQCKIKTPEGDITVTTKGEDSYMEGMMFLATDSTGEMPKQSNGVVLTLGDWTYMWDKETKKGTKINAKEMEAQTENFVIEEEEIDEPEDFSEMAEEWDNMGYDYECHEVKYNKKMFQEPKDVEFRDLNAMMGGFNNKSAEIMEQAEKGEEMDMDEINEMMKQFQQ